MLLEEYFLLTLFSKSMLCEMALGYNKSEINCRTVKFVLLFMRFLGF